MKHLAWDLHPKCHATNGPTLAEMSPRNDTDARPVRAQLKNLALISMFTGHQTALSQAKKQIRFITRLISLNKWKSLITEYEAVNHRNLICGSLERQSNRKHNLCLQACQQQ